jgi:hypothetical protein
MGWPDILAKATLSRAETMLALLKAASTKPKLQLRKTATINGGGEWHLCDRLITSQ